jgi:hypothetical protein
MEFLAGAKDVASVNFVVPALTRSRDPCAVSRAEDQAQEARQWLGHSQITAMAI